MNPRHLLIGSILLFATSGPAVADSNKPTYRVTGLVVDSADPQDLGAPQDSADFPPAHEVRSRTVNDLTALLDRMRARGSESRVAFRTLTLDEMVHQRAWRRSVADELSRRFP